MVVHVQFVCTVQIMKFVLHALYAYTSVRVKNEVYFGILNIAHKL